MKNFKCLIVLLIILSLIKLSAQLEFKTLHTKYGYSITLIKSEDIYYFNPIPIIIGTTASEYPKINLVFELEAVIAT